MEEATEETEGEREDVITTTPQQILTMASTTSHMPLTAERITTTAQMTIATTTQMAVVGSTPLPSSSSVTTKPSVAKHPCGVTIDKQACVQCSFVLQLL